MKSKSSDRWLREHVSDKHVKQAVAEGYRSRAVYKLMALDEKDGLIKPGATVLELGAAPGGWTQYLAEKVGKSGKVVASDILEMDGFTGVTIIQGDFTDNEVADRIEMAMGGGADAVLSDMAPNLSGVAVSDQARAMGLAELALDMAKTVLNTDGVFVVKLFQGEGFDPFMRELKSAFKSVKVRKPEASRARSREIYAVARNLI
ncbi:MAG: 23S rRNA methyltransferase [Gammaproteobacteria bacterium]|nr:23S rRNA methyltransferase [Gammaproteobacteria bacterium]